MKKIYSIIGALAITASAVAQDATVGKKFTTTFDKAKSTQYLAKTAVVAGDTISWNSTPDFLPVFAGISQQLYRYGYTTGGSVFGKNADGLNKCAQGYANLNNTPLVITKAVFAVYDKHSVGSGSSSVKVELWNMAANKAKNASSTSTAGAFNTPGPNTKLGTVSLTWSQIDTVNFFTVATFSTPINVSGDFAIAVDAGGLAAGDTIGILADAKGDAQNLDYTYHYFGTTWYCSDFLFSDPANGSSGDLDCDIAIFGVLGTGTAVHEFYNGVKLSDVFPNPATENANIQYSLEKDAKNVSFVVLDMQGKKVYEEPAQDQAAGTYTIKFNTSSLNAGSYFYQLRANGAVVTKELVITK
ncbi:MAG: T9SS type A sorting domain-containing protein [Bacteroidetes bacterium]|nr:T9SS type A sorting domain-containing protein [Bacteroidota bacterium]